MQPQSFERSSSIASSRPCARVRTTPMGDEQLSRLAPSETPRTVAALQPRPPKPSATSTTGGAPSAARRERFAATIAGALAFRAGRSNRSRLLCARQFLESVDETRHAIRRSTSPFPML
jgi:hypothetical protein